jgi:hypothetical protein
MRDLVVQQTLVQVPIVLLGSLITCLVALAYIRRYRLERPAIGVFNGRDVAVLYVFIIVLPALYVVLPPEALIGFLILTFCAALSIGLRPVVPRKYIWPAVGLAIGLNIWMARTLLGTSLGWELMLIETSIMVVLAAVAVSNLYVQGGMRLQHVAWFALVLGAYDVTFSLIIPFIAELADAFIGHPLNPAIGFRMGLVYVDIGLGDLLVYALFVIAALKAYGPKAARLALVIVGVFGSVAPSVMPLILDVVTRGEGNAVVPAQIFFGPPALLTYLWLKKRYGRERTFAEFAADPYAAVLPRRRDAAPADYPVSPAPAGASEEQPASAVAKPA